MQFSVSVEGREVIASGLVVLAATDRKVVFDLSGMKFEVCLQPGSLPLEVNFVREDSKRITVLFSGLFPEFTAAWKLTGIAEADNRQIDLDVMIYSQSSAPDCVRQLSFSFTAHPAQEQAWATPAPVRFT